MLGALGFSHVSNEVAAWFAFAVALGSLVTAWIIDSIMQDEGFGVLGGAVLLFVGALGGVALWNLYEGPVIRTDPVTLTLLCVGSGFSLVFALAAARRLVQ